MCAPPSSLEITPPGSGGPIVVTDVHDADGHERIVRGGSVQAFRTGSGRGPNLTATSAGAGYVSTWVRAGFPMMSRAIAAPDRVLAIAVLAAPPGSRWCDHDLNRGDMLFYGPEVNHTAVNPTGVNFTFASMDLTELRRTAETMGLAPTCPGPGEVTTLPHRETRALWSLLASLTSPYARARDHDQGPELLRTTVHTLAHKGPASACRRVDSGLVVSACLDYAERAQRVPSIDELCAASYVCRRKLWEVFYERYGTSPARFFRSWGLAQARTRLLAADAASTTVLDIATNLGFGHHGRFSTRYTQMFGEKPSETLRTTN